VGTYIHFLSWFVCCFLSFAHAQTEPSTAKSTFFSQIPLEENCFEVYDLGKEHFQKGVLSKKISPQYFDEGIAEIENPVCHFAFSAGIFDAQHLVLQVLISEFVLEQQEWRFNNRGPSAKSLKDYFSKRLKEILIEAAILDKFTHGTVGYENVINSLFTTLHEKALDVYQAIPFGRFVFTTGRITPYTIYNYQTDSQGKILFGENGDPLTTQGSYELRVKWVHEEFQKLAEEYSRFNPGLIFDLDYSWIWNSKKRSEKEEYFMNSSTYFFKEALGLNIDFKYIKQINDYMFAKFRAQYERDISGLETIKIGLYAAPFIPVAIYLAPAGLIAAGVSTTTAKTVVISLAALPVVGFGGYALYQGTKAMNENPGVYRFYHLLDDVVVSVIGSFPLAVALPALTGAIAWGGNAAWVGGKELLLTSLPLTLARLKQLGFVGSLRALPGGTVSLIKTWCTVYWKNKLFFLNVLSGATTSIVWEIVTREYIIHLAGEIPEERFFIKDNEGNISLNSRATYTLATSVFLGNLGRPIEVLVKNPLLRYMAWRVFHLGSALTVSSLTKKGIEPGLMQADFEYGALIGAPVGELERLFLYSDKIKSLNPHGKKFSLPQFAAVTGFNLLMKFKSPFRIRLLDYRINNPGSFKDFTVTVFRDLFDLDMSEMPDQELLDLFDVSENLSDEDFIELMQIEIGVPSDQDDHLIEEK
jgi:hypothetical protein